MSNTHADSEQLMREAMSHHRAGRLGEAERTYLRILEQTSEHSGALHLLGVIAHQAKRYDLAIDFFNRAIAVQPADAQYHFALGRVLKDSGRSEEAIGSFQRVLALMPEFVDALGSLGIALWEKNRWGEALACFERASALRPESALIQNDVGNVLKMMGRLNEAIERYRKAIQLEPRYAEAYNNLGTTLKETGRVAESVASYRTALSLKPDLAEAWCNLGDALRESGDWAGAIEACERAVALNPGLAEAYGNWGNALNDAGHEEESIARYQQALSLKPAYVEMYNNVGQILKGQGKLDQAIGHFTKALEIRPEYAEALGNMGCALWESGRVGEGVRYCQRALTLKPNSPAIHSNLIFLMQYDDGFGEPELRAELERWNLSYAASLEATPSHFTNELSAERRLRIGYISADFRDHVVARNLMPLFRNRDRERFEVCCYHNSGVNDAMTAQLKSLSDGWRDIRFLNDDKAAEQVRRDGMDILVDLSLHTAGNRLQVLARKPAPIQGTFAGYPGSTGLTAIDFRLTDSWLDPKEKDPANYSERSIHLESFWCYEPRGDEPDVNRLPALQNGFITFGCLNNFSKVNDRVLRLWGGLMVKTPYSRLLLLTPVGRHRERTLEILKECGVSSGRVRFEEPCSRAGYLKLYHQMDVGLDTLPYNGHTTSLDSYWMGVPVVTLVGKTVVGRAGLSQLMNLGLPEWVARSESAFVEIASRTAGDLTGLAKLRGTLRERMRGSVLMDGKRFAHTIEAAYLEMWKNWVGAGNG